MIAGSLVHVLCAVALAVDTSGGGKVDWQRNKTLEEIFPVAKETNKPILLYFMADWEPACAQLDAGAFSDDTVVKETENYVRLIVDCTDTKVLERMRKQIPNFKDVPVVYFLNNVGNILDISAGVAEPATMLKKLKEAPSKPVPPPQNPNPQGRPATPQELKEKIDQMAKRITARIEKELADSEDDLMRDLQRIIKRELTAAVQRQPQPRPQPSNSPPPQKRGVYIGVKSELFTDAQRKELGLEAGIGLKISELTKDGPAEKGGVLPGDVLVQIGTAAITERNIGDVISNYKNGDQADVLVIRGKEKMTLKVTFTERK